MLVARAQRRIAEEPVAGLYRCCAQAAMTHEAHNAEVASTLLPGQIVQIVEWVQVARSSWRGRMTTGEHTANFIILFISICDVRIRGALYFVRVDGKH